MRIFLVKFLIILFIPSLALAGTHVQTTSTSATDNSIVRMDGTSGQIIQKSTAVVDDNGNVGIGTSTAIVSKLTVFGGGIAGEFVNKGWELIALQPSALALSATTNEVSSFVVHKGVLYVGYFTNFQTNSSAVIYKWTGNQLSLVHSFGTGTHFGSLFLAEYNGNLYAGISGLTSGDGDVYVSTDDGATWSSSLAEGTAKFAWSMAVFKGKLYVGQGFSASSIKSFDGTTWSTSYAGLSGAGLVMWLEVFNGKLYAALASSGGGGNPAILSTIDGVTWTTDYNPAKTTYTQINYLKEFRGKLYADVIQGASGTNDILVRNNSDGTWSAIATALSGDQCHAMLNYNDTLYVGCTVTGGTVVYKSYDGVNFTSDFVNNYAGGKGTEGFRMIDYDGSLYLGIGFATTTTGDIWRKTDSLGQLFNTSNEFNKRLRFNTNNNYPFGNDPSLISMSSPMTFDSNVGIGTINPIFTFQITKADGNNMLDIFDISDNYHAIKIDGNGTVGIGSSAPDSTVALDVNGPLTVRSGDFTYNQVGGLNKFIINDVFGGTGAIFTVQSQTFNNSTIIRNNVGIGTFTAPQARLIVYAGNVGIGSLTPGQILDVIGTVRSTQYIDTGLTANALVTTNANKQLTSGSTALTSEQTISYQPGLLTAVNGTIGVYAKFVYTSTVDNLIGSAVTFSCIANPTITMYECGTSATCASSPVTIGTVTITAAGTATVGTVSNPAITAGDYVGFAMTAGTCASIDVSAVAQVHSN